MKTKQYKISTLQPLFTHTYTYAYNDDFAL